MTLLIFYPTPKENAFARLQAMPLFVYKLYVAGSNLGVQYGARTKAVEDQAIPCETRSDSDSDSGSDRGQQRIVATQ
jgi:hypothetical protein